MYLGRDMYTHILETCANHPDVDPFLTKAPLVQKRPVNSLLVQDVPQPLAHSHLRHHGTYCEVHRT